MQDSAVQLAAALRQRVAIINDEESRREPKQHIAKLRAASERIEQLQAELPVPVHPQLAHFLSRASYNKALEFLENDAAMRAATD